MLVGGRNEFVNSVDAIQIFKVLEYLMDFMEESKLDVYGRRAFTEPNPGN